MVCIGKKHSITLYYQTQRGFLIFLTVDPGQANSTGFFLKRSFSLSSGRKGINENGYLINRRVSFFPVSAWGRAEKSKRNGGGLGTGIIRRTWVGLQR
jgi:hypothetical protein